MWMSKFESERGGLDFRELGVISVWDDPSTMVGTVPGTKDADLGHLLKSMDEELLCKTL